VFVEKCGGNSSFTRRYLRYLGNIEYIHIHLEDHRVVSLSRNKLEAADLHKSIDCRGRLCIVVLLKALGKIMFHHPQVWITPPCNASQPVI
jgi:hypothetical protein